MLQLTIDIDQEIDGPPTPAIDAFQITGQSRSDRSGVQERLQLAAL